VKSVVFEKNVIQSSLIEGEAIGKAMGLEEGLEKGKAMGLEEGLEKGKAMGLEEGKAMGLEEGLEKGKVMGLEEGEAIGAEKTKIEIVIASSKAGLPLETIIGITGFTPDKISEILLNQTGGKR
jgi:flagellar biosynthesis/type III secretory pathway protein FliH